MACSLLILRQLAKDPINTHLSCSRALSNIIDLTRQYDAKFIKRTTRTNSHKNDRIFLVMTSPGTAYFEVQFGLK